MVDAFEKLGDFGWSNVVVIFLLFLILTVAFLQSLRFIRDYFGIETKQSLKEKEVDNKIQAFEERITELEHSANKFNNDRIHDREQSFGFQNQWINVVKEMSDKQDTIIARVDALAEQNRKYQLADIRETLLQAYRYYTGESTNPLKMWTEIEASAFKEQYDTYKDNGGNGYMESEVKPEMNKLHIVHLDDYEAMAELMSSRTHCRK